MHPCIHASMLPCFHPCVHKYRHGNTHRSAQHGPAAPPPSVAQFVRPNRTTSSKQIRAFARPRPDGKQRRTWDHRPLPEGHLEAGNTPSGWRGSPTGPPRICPRRLGHTGPARGASMVTHPSPGPDSRLPIGRYATTTTATNTTSSCSGFVVPSVSRCAVVGQRGASPSVSRRLGC